MLSMSKLGTEVSAASEQQIEDLLMSISKGADLVTACDYAGLDIALVTKWLEIGEKTAAADIKPKDDQYEALWRTVKQARADAVLSNILVIHEAAQNGNWQAATWWLERNLPDLYGRNRKTTGSAPAPKEIKNYE